MDFALATLSTRLPDPYRRLAADVLLFALRDVKAGLRNPHDEDILWEAIQARSFLLTQTVFHSYLDLDVGMVARGLERLDHGGQLPAPFPPSRIAWAASQYESNKDAGKALGITGGSFGRLCRRYDILTPQQRRARKKNIHQLTR